MRTLIVMLSWAIFLLVLDESHDDYRAGPPPLVRAQPGAIKLSPNHAAALQEFELLALSPRLR